MGRPDPLIQWRAFYRTKIVSPWSRRAADICRSEPCRPDTCRSEPCRPEAPAAAALSMPKEAAVTVRNFSIVNPLLFEPHLSDEAANAAAGAAPPDDCSDFHRCTGKMPQPRPPHNQKGTFPSVLRSLFPRLLHKHHVSR